MTTTTMPAVRRACVVAACVWLAQAGVARAQVDSSISVGGDFGVDIPASDALRTTNAFGVAFRIPRPDGWSAAWDFGSVSADLDHAIGGDPSGIGSLSVRPLLGGAAYTWRGGRFEATATLTAGVSLIALDLSEAGRDRLRLAFGPGDAEANTKAALALMPKLTLWYDLNRWFALNATAGYLRTRSEVTLEMPSGIVDRFAVKGDRLRLSVGIVVKAY